MQLHWFELNYRLLRTKGSLRHSHFHLSLFVGAPGHAGIVLQQLSFPVGYPPLYFLDIKLFSERLEIRLIFSYRSGKFENRGSNRAVTTFEIAARSASASECGSSCRT